MSVNAEYCDPFEKEMPIWVRMEHLGRYLWAADYISSIPHARVADIATATGYGAKILSLAAEDVIGIDRNEDYLAIGRKSAQDNLSFICNDLNKDGWQQRVGSRDVIVCFETIEHVSNPASLLISFHRLLNADGALLLSAPNSEYECFDEKGSNRDPFHLHSFSSADLYELVSCSGYRIERHLGQDVCNRAMSALDDLKHRGLYSQGQLSNLLSNSTPTDLEILSRLLAYPSEISVDLSYSNIVLCKKRQL